MVSKCLVRKLEGAYQQHTRRNRGMFGKLVDRFLGLPPNKVWDRTDKNAQGRLSALCTISANLIVIHVNRRVAY